MKKQPITNPSIQPIPPIQRVVAVLWPSFIISGIATIIFFTAFDPYEVLNLNISRTGAYSIGFFMFWLMSTASSLLTLYFQMPCHKIAPPTHYDEV